MQPSLTSVGLALVLLAIGATAQVKYPEEGKCFTPKGTPGTCINIKACPSLVALIQQQPLRQDVVEYLRRSQCGFEKDIPKVCCELNLNLKFQPRPPVTPKPTVQPGNDKLPPDVTKHPNLRLLQHNICGPIYTEKIIGGNVTAVNEIPWMALLAYDAGRGVPEFRCGGSIINKRYILTAAHCVTKLANNLRLIGVRVGEHDITKERDCDDEGTSQEVCAERYQDFRIEEVIFHEKYSSVTYHDDIAILRVHRDIDFRPDNAKPICMPIGSSALIRSKKLMVTGWGVTEQRISSTVLLKIVLPIYPQEECAKTYKRQAEIWHKQICIGGEQGKDSCSGDSGGPLVAPTSYFGSSLAADSRFIQYGVVSFGVKLCGTQGFPGVYTRVDYYLDWILNHMRD